ncbi:methyl-accepting chemotaxis protein [Rugamonas sp. CCM 8940]|uniref:methyl-accepting chemotaxis protein n=1 Tax=Rugamonas sp. CCM 8940 TaxID=2765359 RepID=UPI0018F2F452|nr:methyl-accepting chemotaxis protein [Rugamonas sp. CCM 8940]MBJ7310635.1 MCP four helix bundle domain-containing protein [Rugamonas sp. CCM 8940]
MLSKLRLGPKLLLAPGVVLLLLILLSVGAYVGLVRQNQWLDNMVQQRAVRMKAADDLVAGANRAHTESYQLLTWINASFSPSRIDALIRDLRARHAALDRQFAQLEMAIESDGAERRFVAQSQAAHAEYVKAVADVVELSMVDQSMAANAMSKAERAFEVVALRLQELSTLEQQLSETAYHRAEAEFKTISVLMPLVVALSIALSLLVTVAVRKAMLKEVSEIGAAARDLAEGNLTVRERVYGNDEIAETSRALDSSIRNLNTTLKNILGSAQAIDDASREIAQGNADLSSRTGQAASTLEQTSSSMQELSATVNQTADNARTARQLALCASDFAQRGGSVVQRLVVTMASIRGSSRKVGEIVGVIDGLAMQSNLLALNAAVEAARAGPHGAGFAVVAGEVRELAQRSALAAREIKQLIASSVAEIEHGSRSVEEAGSSMADIVGSVLQVGELIGQISQASVQQAAGLQGVHEAIVQMDQVTQQNVVLVEQAASAAQGLQEQALSLSQAVEHFKLDDGDPDPAPGGPALGNGRTKKNAVGQAARLRLASNRS